MRPRADEVLTSVIATIDEYIAPDLTNPFAKSLVLTVKNLLNHVKLRVEREGPALFEDNRELRMLLTQIMGNLAVWTQDGFDEAFENVREEIKNALEHKFYDKDDYPSIITLTDEATVLRWALTHAIQALQDNREALRDDAAYAELRQNIRNYLGRQLKRESTWIDEAFIGDRR